MHTDIIDQLLVLPRPPKDILNTTLQFVSTSNDKETIQKELKLILMIESAYVLKELNKPLTVLNIMGVLEEMLTAHSESTKPNY